MKFSRLLSQITIGSVNGVFTGMPGAPDPDVKSIHYRSQSVLPGGLFVAIPGHKADGHAFIGDAVARGAVAVIAEQPVDIGAPCVQVADSRRALAQLSAGFYQNPSDALSVIGITGTNGKTTTTYLVESMLVAADRFPGVIGTINYRYAGKTVENPVTTPESLDLQRILAEMRQSGITHVAMEVSSHAIDLSRVERCGFDVAAFTNLTQDHLDYHGSMENYWACKQRLFTEYLARGAKKDRAVAVINVGNAHGRELFSLLRESFPNQVISYGVTGEGRVYPVDFDQDGSGIRGRIMTPAGSFSFRSTLVGQYNLENILCATGIGLALTLPLSAICDGIQSLRNVPGRLEPVMNKTGRFIFVDYAHTPDALDNVLTALSALKRGARLLCVFGCGGDRDRAKRPIMGKIAAGHADLVIVTSDNPRTEAPERIIDEIVAGIRRENTPLLTAADLVAGKRANGYLVAPDRKTAIRLGLMASGAGDILLVAGKGHETYQILGTTKIAFDDRRETLTALSELEKEVA
ncbi:MAG: UDP-N-acetylmuramoyl-L-alanyl-D-glutamate--2,6-diaminopimelate ligase [Pseudomonadota bacterium]